MRTSCNLRRSLLLHGNAYCEVCMMHVLLRTFPWLSAAQGGSGTAPVRGSVPALTGVQKDTVLGLLVRNMPSLPIIHYVQRQGGAVHDGWPAGSAMDGVAHVDGVYCSESRVWRVVDMLWELVHHETIMTPVTWSVMSPSTPFLLIPVMQTRQLMHFHVHALSLPRPSAAASSSTTTAATTTTTTTASASSSSSSSSPLPSLSSSPSLLSPHTPYAMLDLGLAIYCEASNTVVHNSCLCFIMCMLYCTLHMSLLPHLQSSAPSSRTHNGVLVVVPS